MTVAGDTTTTTAYAFTIFAAGDLDVYRNGVLQTLTTNYTIGAGAGGTNGGLYPDAGGVVTWVNPSPLTDGDVITLVRNTTRSRSTDFTQGGALNAAALNEQLDRIEAYKQEDDKALTDRALLLPVTDDLDPVAGLSNVLPDSTARASKYLAFDAQGNVVVQAGTGATVGGLTDATVTPPVADNEVLAYDSGTSEWINQTAAEAGLATATHTHGAADIASGTVAHERGGLEADVSAFAGLIRIDGGATSNITTLAGLNVALGTNIPEGPGTSTDDALARYNGAGGALQNSSVTLSDGGVLTIPGSGSTGGLVVQNPNDAASNQVSIFRGGNRATAADNDEGYLTFTLDDDLGTQQEFARLSWAAPDVTSTSKDGRLDFDVQVNNALTNVAAVDGEGLITSARLQFTERAVAPATPTAGRVVHWFTNDAIPRPRYTNDAGSTFGCLRYVERPSGAARMWDANLSGGMSGFHDVALTISAINTGTGLVTYTVTASEDALATIEQGTIGQVYVHNITLDEVARIASINTAANQFTLNAADSAIYADWAVTHTLDLRANGLTDFTWITGTTFDLSGDAEMPTGAVFALVSGNIRDTTTPTHFGTYISFYSEKSPGAGIGDLALATGQIINQGDGGWGLAPVSASGQVHTLVNTQGAGTGFGLVLVSGYFVQ